MIVEKNSQISGVIFGNKSIDDNEFVPKDIRTDSGEVSAQYIANGSDGLHEQLVHNIMKSIIATFRHLMQENMNISAIIQSQELVDGH